MNLVLDLLLSFLGLPVLAAASYLFVATLLSAKLPLPAEAASKRRFRFIVPAHNESAGIAATVKSLLAVDYPQSSFDVLVVADNCVDDTAEQARSAGAVVLERHDTERRGKGYALLLAFSSLPADRDAVVVIDADTLVSPNILRAFAARLDAGALAVQADYAVRNPNAGWRTRLIAIAFGAFHIVRSRARERLGLSCGLRGNGMCFGTALLAAVPHEAFSIVEDVEYGIRLGEAGYRVYYADEAHVYGEMVSTAAAASSQRRRWEEGRKQLIRDNGWRLLRAGLARQNRVLFDLALDLLVPPLSRIAILAVLGALAAAALSFWSQSFALSVVTFSWCLFAIVLYVLRGWSVSGTGLRGLLDLGLAPIYVVWKASLRLRKPAKPTSSWVRTKREESSE
ncbi:MAG TPA: glycosyltransferase family 2 protein [Polyangiaceae bacterium]|nr:glycosyltransferase family 2 protein [Polyangiaceae bacterium]